LDPVNNDGNTQVTKERKMKKIIAAAAGLMMVGTLATSVSAVESQFGGYWRTRMFNQVDFDGTDRGSEALVDTRTRLYYTAVFNENLKFVNKFEFNNTWGDAVGGDVGADGTGIFRIKNSYVDAKMGNLQFKVGTQGATLARGFLFADDFSGVVAIANVSDTVTLPFAWMKVEEEQATGGTETDYYAFFPIVKVSDALTLNPYIVLDHMNDDGNTSVYWAGIDADLAMDGMSFWGTAIYNFGEVSGNDVSAFLVAAGGSFGPVHAQAFYSTGDDDPVDPDVEQFVMPAGSSYYWAEILGYGVFDIGTGYTGSGVADDITNIWAANIGVTVKPADKLTLSADLWYAELAEDAANGESDLGFEVDVKATYMVMDNLKAEIVAAYLAAGDAYGLPAGSDEDPIEVGVQLSLSF
jgi:hypothetical protein